MQTQHHMPTTGRSSHSERGASTSLEKFQSPSTPTLGDRSTNYCSHRGNTIIHLALTTYQWPALRLYRSNNHSRGSVYLGNSWPRRQVRGPQRFRLAWPSFVPRLLINHLYSQIVLTQANGSGARNTSLSPTRTNHTTHSGSMIGN